MDVRELNRLNGLFREYLGEAAPGRPRFQWRHAGDCGQWRQCGYRNGAAGVLRPHFEFDDMRSRYGDVWLVAKWLAPPDESSWLNQFQGLVPYPSDGNWIPVADRCWLDEGIEPNERATREAIGRLLPQMDMDIAARTRVVTENLEKHDAAIQKQADDMVDEATPAFGNVPGKNEHVSFLSTPASRERVPCHQ